MSNISKYVSAAFLLGASGCFVTQVTKGVEMDWFKITEGKIDSYDELISFIPATVQQVEVLEKRVIDDMSIKINQFVEQDRAHMTKDSVLYELDRLAHAVHSVTSCLHLVSMVHPDKEMRDASQKSFLNLQSFAVDNFDTKKVYAVFEDFSKRDDLIASLDKEEKYFYEDEMRGFRLSGLMLDDASFEKMQALKKEAMALSAEFSKNISADEKSMLCERDELKGMSDAFVDALEMTDDGKYVVKTDYPTATELLDYCENERTREKFWHLFNNRAYPQNVPLLEQLLAKRHEMATMLGYKNFAESSLSTKMAKSPERVRAFMESLTDRAQKKAAQEVAAWKENGKDLVNFDGDKIYPWNVSFLKKAYERDHFKFDERDLRPYFSMEDSIQGIFSIYQTFLGLRFEIEKARNAWHDDVQLITVYDKDATEPRGYIFLDLHPRPAKYSHACHGGIMHSLFLPDGNTTKSVGMVIANFPKATKIEPALLKYSDVVTFFHEFGHAMHSVLGRTRFGTQAGTLVLRDFVEMPSQMFEEWLWQPAMIKKIARHYQTGELLSDVVIEKMIAKKKFDMGYWLCRQLSFSDYALTLHEQENPHLDLVLKDIFTRYTPDLAWNDNNHTHASFGHLTGYGAGYYGYAWSRVFAIDIFEQLKKDNFSPEAGKRFVDLVLSKGGSAHPDELLENYLGRAPSAEPYFETYGL